MEILSVSLFTMAYGNKRKVNLEEHKLEIKERRMKCMTDEIFAQIQQHFHVLQMFRTVTPSWIGYFFASQ